MDDRQPAFQAALTVAPRHLDSLHAICTVFRKGRGTVLRWRTEGAPIAVDGGRYQAEYNTLMAWLVAFTKNSHLQDG